MAGITSEQRLAMIRNEVPRELVATMEGLYDSLHDFVDLKNNPGAIFNQDVADLAIEYAMENVDSCLDKFQYEDNAGIYMESLTDDPNETPTFMDMGSAHRHNLRKLMENSIMEARIAHPNQRNLDELTPFDAFLPFTIIRSYLPLVMKDIVPYVVPEKDFIRIKWSYKYVVTKDNQKRLRPDVYNDPSAISEILASAKGKRVTETWYPLGTEVADDAAEGEYDYADVDGKKYTMPEDKLSLSAFNLLAESGGQTQIGDQLDKDICVWGARAKVTNAAGEESVVEVTRIEAYPDLTSINPQRSVSFTVRYPVRDSDGNIESFVEDIIFGSYSDATSTFNLVSLNGVTKQVQFGGHLSNKNNTEYIQFTNDFRTEDHPIPEGYRSNVPITPEDMNLYRQTASIDIVAHAINEMTEMFTEFEDGEVINKIDEEWNVTLPMGKNHGFRHFEKGPVAFYKEVSVKYNNDRFHKRNDFVQDAIAYALDRFIDDVRTTCQNEPFKVVLFAHPNICSLFVGQNIDWKIEPGTSISEGIRTDYNMGIYTSSGNKMRLVSSMKFKEEDGVRFIVLPVNEQNFLTWKHFKYSMYFDRDHRISEMPNVPNVLGIARYHTHSYVPMQGKLVIKDYK